ncbi:MAG: CRISPR-associated endonuclease Cas2 [Tissierellia bacterium]|nr:CRISPR-associated endonuclease Cas2 [Tissierellia bacterium]
MMILVTYDVNTTDESGRRRLRRVAKICVNFGQRVQNSVFECSVDPAQYVEMKGLLRKEIDLKKDSLRFYRLGKNWQPRVEMMGKNETYDPDRDLLLI